MTVDLRELIESGRVHVMDGAMGTVLYSRGVFVNVCYDELNLNQPDLVQEVHEAYVQSRSMTATWVSTLRRSASP